MADKYSPYADDDPPVAAAPATAPTGADRYSPHRDEVAPPAAAPPGASRSWGDTLGRWGRSVGDFAAAAENSATFGLAPRRDALAGWIAGDYPSYSAGLEAEQQKLAARRERSPYASIAGDVGGALAIPGLGGAGLAARWAPAALAQGSGLAARAAHAGKGLLARGAGYGLEGAGIGALQGAGNTFTGKPIDYLTNATTGGLMGGILGAGIGGAFGPRGGMRSTAEVPDTTQLLRDKRATYDRLNQYPQMYEPAWLSRQADIAENTLRTGRGPYIGNINGRFHESRSPETWKALDEMRGAPTAFPTGQAPVSPGDIDFIRKGLTNLNPVTQGGEIVSAGVVKRAMDDFVRNPPQGAVLPGMEAAAAEAAAVANRAHFAHGGHKRSQFWDDVISNAQDAAGAQHSGLNLQNVLRQQVKAKLRQSDGQSAASKAGFNADEIGAMRDFTRVPWGDTALRYIDRLAGGGGGLGAMAAGGVGGGFAGQYFKDSPGWGTVVGAGIPAAGLGLRILGNRRALQNVNELGDMIRRRTPLYQERAATAPTVAPRGGAAPGAMRDAITIEMLQQMGVPRITVTPLRPGEE